MAKLTPGIVAALMVSGSVILVASNQLLHRDHSKKKKKVRFSDSVVEPKGDNREFRRRHSQRIQEQQSKLDREGNCDAPEPPERDPDEEAQEQSQELHLPTKKVKSLLGAANLPANRVALYSNMYRDRFLRKALY